MIYLAACEGFRGTRSPPWFPCSLEAPEELNEFLSGCWRSKLNARSARRSLKVSQVSRLRCLSRLSLELCSSLASRLQLARARECLQVLLCLDVLRPDDGLVHLGERKRQRDCAADSLAAFLEEHLGDAPAQRALATQDQRFTNARETERMSGLALLARLGGAHKGAEGAGILLLGEYALHADAARIRHRACSVTCAQRLGLGPGHSQLGHEQKMKGRVI